MRISAVILALTLVSSSAFVPPRAPQSTTQLATEKQPWLQQFAAAVVVGATFWASPAFDVGLPQAPAMVAVAKEMASGTGSRVNKDPESLLRYGLPINNKDVRELDMLA
jgi:hypothetical protein